MVANDAYRAAMLVAAICLSAFAADPAVASPRPDAGEAATATPGDRLTELAGKTFGFMGKEGEPSLLIRFENVPGQGFRVTEIDQAGTSTTTVAHNQRGARWKGSFVSMPIDFKAKETASIEPDGSLMLAWSSWGTTSERTYRVLQDGSLERRGRNASQDTDWHKTQLVPVSAGQETLLRDQLAIESELFKQDVAARVKVLMAESAERRRQNREKFWSGLAQVAVVAVNVAAEVAADMDTGDRASLSGVADVLDRAAPGMPDGRAEPQAGGAPPPAAPPAAAAPLRFVMMISLMNKPGDTVNPTCYSNVVTRPGPPGWGAPGFLPQGSSERARQSVETLRDRFLAQCRASGREITSVGNFNYHWNQSPGDEQRVADARPRYAEDVLVSME
jgi:hypothetical protein